MKWRIRHIETKRNVADFSSRLFEGKNGLSGHLSRTGGKPLQTRDFSRASQTTCFWGDDVTPSAGSMSTHSSTRIQLKLSDLLGPPGLGTWTSPEKTHVSSCASRKCFPLRGEARASHCKQSSGQPRRTTGKVLRCWEIFSGCGNLTKALKKSGFLTLDPIDILDDPELNLSDRRVQEAILSIIRSGAVDYIHLGTPCTVFSRARRNITRKEAARAKEILGCELATFTVEACMVASEYGVGWSIENPQSSRIWEFPMFDALYGMSDLHIIDLDLCRYGMDYQKPTRLLTTVPELLKLSMRCFHKKHDVVLKGKVQVSEVSGTKWVNRTQLAGSYPARLVDASANALRGVSRAGHDSQESLTASGQAVSFIKQFKRQESTKQQVGFSSAVASFVDAIVFGQHSKAEAARRRAKRRRSKTIEKTKAEILERCRRHSSS